MSSKATNTPKFGFALEYVADIEATKCFYVDVLGLDIDREHPTFVQFRDASGSYFAIASDGSMDGSNDLELYWLVDDAEAAYKALAQRAEVTLPLAEKPFGKVFGLKDPAGEPRYLVELARHRPSKQV